MKSFGTLGSIVVAAFLLISCVSVGPERSGQAVRTEIDGWSASGVNIITNNHFDEFGYDYFGFDVKLINYLTKTTLDSRGNSRLFYLSNYILYIPYRIKYVRITYVDGGREILTGPRGGQYYINKNGNKTYVKRR